MNDSSSTTGFKLTDTSRPLDGAMQVAKARDEYLAENAFTVAEYTAPTFRLKFFGRYFDAPNSPDRQRAIPLHDLHHIALGYGTDLPGEAEVAIWELRGGCRTWVVYYLNAVAALIGVALAPRRMLAAWRSARSARALYRGNHDMDALLALRVSELRALLGVPEEGIAGSRRLHEDAQVARDKKLEGANRSAPASRHGDVAAAAT